MDHCHDVRCTCGKADRWRCDGGRGFDDGNDAQDGRLRSQGVQAQEDHSQATRRTAEATTRTRAEVSADGVGQRHSDPTASRTGSL